jgi:hypothetical protein
VVLFNQNLLSSHILSKNVKITIYKTIILPIALDGCETWHLVFTTEHRLRVSENKRMTRISGPKGDKMIGNWRKLHIEELHNLYSSPNIFKNKMDEACSMHGEMRSTYRISVRKPEGKRGGCASSVS